MDKTDLNVSKESVKVNPASEYVNKSLNKPSFTESQKRTQYDSVVELSSQIPVISVPFEGERIVRATPKEKEPVPHHEEKEDHSMKAWEILKEEHSKQQQQHNNLQEIVRLVANKGETTKQKQSRPGKVEVKAKFKAKAEKRAEETRRRKAKIERVSDEADRKGRRRDGDMMKISKRIEQEKQPEQEKLDTELEKIIEETPHLASPSETYTQHHDEHKQDTQEQHDSSQINEESKIPEAKEQLASSKPIENPDNVDILHDRKFSAMQEPKALGEPEINLSTEEVIYYEGELKKYRPGISSQYIARWCQATGTHFNYYKSHWSANCWLSKPLMSIPYSCIENVVRVDVKIPTKAKPKETKPRKDYQFEIFLKKDVDVSFLARSIDYSAYETRGVVGKKRLDTAANPKSFSASIPRSKYESIVANAAEGANSRHGRNLNLSALDHSVKTGSKDRIRNWSVSRIIPDKMVKEGYLMRTPSTYSRSRELSPYRYKGSMDISTSVDQKHAVLVEHEGLIFAGKRQQEQFESFEEKHAKELKNIVLTEDIIVKNPSAWVPALSSNF